MHFEGFSPLFYVISPLFSFPFFIFSPATISPPPPHPNPLVFCIVYISERWSSNIKPKTPNTLYSLTYLFLVLVRPDQANLGLLRSALGRAHFDHRSSLRVGAPRIQAQKKNCFKGPLSQV